MSLDFQQVRQQIQALVSKAPQREKELQNLQDQADKLLGKYAIDLDYLKDKVSRAAALVRNLRCAIPTDEPLTETYPLPGTPKTGTIIAADGSQINPNRHFALSYCLVNVGAIQMQIGSPQAPVLFIRSELFYDERQIAAGAMTEGMVALMRDQRERQVLADMAAQTDIKPVITFTDGPIELWGREERPLERTQYFKEYLAALAQLRTLGAATAGYVDKPASDLVVRLLELGALDENKLSEAGDRRWLAGVFDTVLYAKLLDPGERSPIFKLQSQSSKHYPKELAVHFFYLNVSLDQDPELARVEIPAWVAENKDLLNALHAILVGQCQVIGNARHPYLLHRAHETAVVTRDDKDQVDAMIAREMALRGLSMGRKSAKQTAKDDTRQPKKMRKRKR